MRTTNSAADHVPASESHFAADAIRPEQHIAMLAEAFSLEMTGMRDDTAAAPWPFWQTTLFAMVVGSVLWAGLIAAVRLIV